MGLFKEFKNDFVQHEIKTYQRKGDKVLSEYERLNPDGSVTKSVAYGSYKEGLKYRTFNLGVDGVIREVTAEQAAPVARQVQEQRPQQVQGQRPQPPQEPLQRTHTFHLEPRPKQPQVAVWNMHPQPHLEMVTPWYDQNKPTGVEAKQEVPKEKPEPLPEKSAARRLIDFFGDDFNWYHMKPKALLEPPRFDPFDMLNSLERKPLLENFFNLPLLGDF